MGKLGYQSILNYLVDFRREFRAPKSQKSEKIEGRRDQSRAVARSCAAKIGLSELRGKPAKSVQTMARRKADLAIAQTPKRTIERQPAISARLVKLNYERNMPFDLVNPILAIGFIAICIFSGRILFGKPGRT